MTNFNPSIDEPSRESGSPLLDFWATGMGWFAVTKQNPGKQPFTIVTFRFGNPGWKLISATVPYDFETGEIEMFYSDPKNSFRRQTNRGISDWEALSESLREVYSSTSLTGSAIFDDLFGGRVDPTIEGVLPSKAGRLMHVQKIPTLLNTRNPETNKYEDLVRPAFKVVEVEGVGSATGASTTAVSVDNGNSNGSSVTSAPTATANASNVMIHALEMANGKSEVDFYKEVMEDSVILSNPGLVEQLNKREWVSSMKSMGMIKEVEGILIKA